MRYLVLYSVVGAVAIITIPVILLGEQTADAEVLKTGKGAPDFKLIDSEKGNILTKQTFKGKPLIIFFTTTWCTPCQIGAENLAKYDDEKGSGAFNVLIVFVDEQETDK